MSTEIKTTQDKFTPGPWGFHPLDDGTIRCVYCEANANTFNHANIAIGAGEKVIGELRYKKILSGPPSGFPAVGDVEEFRANAALIIAAPDMLGGLRETLELANRLPLKLRAKLEAIVSKATTIPDAVVHPKEDPAED